MKKFTDAFRGLSLALREKSVRIQCALGMLTVAGGIIIRLDHYEWLAFVICIGLVISLEIVNSVVERVCDLYSEKYDERIRTIKDMSSAFVLVASMAALMVCIITLLRRIL